MTTENVKFQAKIEVLSTDNLNTINGGGCVPSWPFPYCGGWCGTNLIGWSTRG